MITNSISLNTIGAYGIFLLKRQGGENRDVENSI